MRTTRWLLTWVDGYRVPLGLRRHDRSSIDAALRKQFQGWNDPRIEVRKRKFDTRTPWEDVFHFRAEDRTQAKLVTAIVARQLGGERPMMKVDRMIYEGLLAEFHDHKRLMALY